MNARRESMVYVLGRKIRAKSTGFSKKANEPPHEDVAIIDDLASALKSLRIMCLRVDQRVEWCDAVRGLSNEVHRLRCRDVTQGRKPRCPIFKIMHPLDVAYLRSATAELAVVG